MKILAERIKYQRELQGETQVQLADAIKVSQGTISQWEQNVIEPKAEYIVRLSNHFDVTTDYLLGKTDVF